MNLKFISLLALVPLSIGMNAQQVIDKEFLFPNGSLTSTDGTVTLQDISYQGEHRNSKPIEDDLSVAPSINTAAPNCTVYDRGVYHIADGAGLVFNAGDASNYQDYSISMLFKFDYKGYGWGRIIDFSNGTKDAGIYRYQGHNLNFYPNGNVAPDAFKGYDDKYVLLTLTRSREGFINVYFNRSHIVKNYDDSRRKDYQLDPSGNFIVIKDDLVVKREDFAANIAYLRVTNTLLDDTEVFKVYDDLCDKVNPEPSHCYKPANTNGDALETPVGITALKRAGEQWPMERKGGWLALEAKTKGMVLNRVPFDSTGNPVGIPTANFVEGMAVYDTTNNCLKIYTSVDNGSSFAWHCFNTQTCPE